MPELTAGNHEMMVEFLPWPSADQPVEKLHPLVAAARRRQGRDPRKRPLPQGACRAMISNPA